MLLPARPFMPFMAALPLAVLLAWPRGRRRLKAVAGLMVPLGLGFWVIHGGAFASWVGGPAVAVPGRALWALGLWLRILSVVSASQVWMECVPVRVLVRELLSGPLPVGIAFLLASPLLLAEQIRARLTLIREAQLARGVPLRGGLRERVSSLSALIFPLVLGLLNDLPARSAALDMKAFKLRPYRTSLYGPAKDRPSASDGGSGGAAPGGPAVEIRGGAFSPPGGGEPLLRIPRFRLGPGAWALIQGGNGSGKSTLAMILSGGVPEHRPGGLEGDFFVSGEPVRSRSSLHWSPRVQFVQQDPRICFSGCTFTVGEEVAFGPENLALCRPAIRERVEEALAVAGIAHLEDRLLVHLSGGEAQKVLLAAALAMRPRLLLLDEAFSRVRAGDIPVIAGRMRAWGVRHGVSVVLFERKGLPMVPFCDTFARLEEGLLLCGSEADARALAERAARPASPRDRSVGEASSREGASPVLEIRGVRFGWEGAETLLLDGLNERIAGGERVALTGANGAGKSTLLRLCGGLLTPAEGDVRLGGRKVADMDPRQRASRIGFLFQDPERQLFRATVEDELLFALRDERCSADEKHARIEGALNVTGLKGKGKSHPFDLNSAERRMVALATLSVRKLDLILLDEPTRELDDRWLDVFLGWLEVQDAGLLAVSHDLDLAANRFDRVWRLEEGVLR